MIANRVGLLADPSLRSRTSNLPISTFQGLTAGAVTAGPENLSANNVTVNSTFAYGKLNLTRVPDQLPAYVNRIGVLTPPSAGAP
jgi:hypothetical protein